MQHPCSVVEDTSVSQTISMANEIIISSSVLGTELCSLQIHVLKPKVTVFGDEGGGGGGALKT